MPKFFHDEDYDCHQCYKDADAVVNKMILCPKCQNKRCPKATDHRNACTNSNISGQKGSVYVSCDYMLDSKHPDNPLLQAMKNAGVPVVGLFKLSLNSFYRYTFTRCHINGGILVEWHQNDT